MNTETDNELLTSTDFAREGLRLLHSNLGFVSTITKKYSKKFGKSGAKVGNKIEVRLPNRFTPRMNSAQYGEQDVVERKKEITLKNQIGVDMAFSSTDLTLSLDKFSNLYLEPAMSILASHIETDVFRLARECPAIAHSDNMTLHDMLEAKNWMDAQFAPAEQRHVQLPLSHEGDLKKEIRQRFNPRKAISRIYREREISKMSGFTPFVSTLIPEHIAIRSDQKTENTKPQLKEVFSTVKKTIGYTEASLPGPQLLKEGETFCIKAFRNKDEHDEHEKPIDLGYFMMVHPETKHSMNVPQRFVITKVKNKKSLNSYDYTFSPGIIIQQPYQNVTIDDEKKDFLLDVEFCPMSDIDGMISKDFYNQSLFYQAEAFCMCTADLPLPDGLDFSAREEIDGISMRVVRDYDEDADDMITRVDVLFGIDTLMPEFACRVMS